MIIGRFCRSAATTAAVLDGIALLAVACGVSVHVLAYAARADDGFQLNVANQFPHMCKISGSPVYNIEAGSAVTTSAAGAATVDFASDFANADATGREMSGAVRVTVIANAQCDYVLTSAYGALKNVTAGQSGAFRDYYADAHDASAAGAPMHLNALASGVVVRRFTIAAPSGWGFRTVAIEFSIPQTSTPLAAGEYQDVLSLSINPSL